MNLLDHPLIKKYFGCEKMHIPGADCFDCFRVSARILTAMQEPIGEKTRYLFINSEGVEESESMLGHRDKWFHGDTLRLPDRFQPKQECHCCDWREGKGVKPIAVRMDCLCPNAHCEACTCQAHYKCKCTCHKPSPSKVEKKIKEMWDNLEAYDGYFEDDLRDLVRLAKEKK